MLHELIGPEVPLPDRLTRPHRPVHRARILHQQEERAIGCSDDVVMDLERAESGPARGFRFRQLRGDFVGGSHHLDALVDGVDRESDAW